MKPLTVLCNSQSWDLIHETSFFVEVILGGLNRPVHYEIFEPGTKLNIPDDILVVNHCNSLVPLIQAAVSGGLKNIGVVAWCHSFEEDRSYYSSVDYVLRPFFKPAMMIPEGRCKEIAWFTVGYRSGVGPRNRNLLNGFRDRPHEFLYAGFPGTNYDERTQMLAAVDAWKIPAKLKLSGSFSSGVGIHCYRSLLENAKFSLCPAGADDESMRLIESLELGAIPISLNHPFIGGGGPMGDCPLIRLNDWQELGEWYRTADMSVMEVRHRQIGAWWADFKVSEGKKVAAVIERAFEGCGHER